MAEQYNIVRCSHARQLNYSIPQLEFAQLFFCISLNLKHFTKHMQVYLVPLPMLGKQQSFGVFLLNRIYK